MPHRDLAALLLEAEQSRQPCPPPSREHPQLTLADGYRVQALGRELRGNPPLMGWKVALTNPELQRRMGVEHPLFGGLLECMLCQNGVNAAALIRPQVEVEVAVVLGSDLPLGPLTRQQVLSATSGLCAAFDVCDSRIQEGARASDLAADNASAAGYVLGPLAHGLPPALGMTARRNGTVVATAGAAADPLQAVCWLAGELGKLGVALRAGQVVLSGALANPFPVSAGDLVEAEVEGLGSVAARFSMGAL